MSDKERKIYEEMAEKGEDAEILRKAIKQLLYKIVPYEETTYSKATIAKGKAIKFERIEMRDEVGDTYIKYHLTIEFYPDEVIGGIIDGEEIAELAHLKIKSSKEELLSPEKRRIEYLKNKKEASSKYKNWNRFKKNLGMREVEVTFTLDEEGEVND